MGFSSNMVRDSHWLRASRSPSPARSLSPALRESRNTLPRSTWSTRVLSWNIAQCRPSDEAAWDVVENSRRIVSTIFNANADVVCIQGAPSDDWGRNELSPYYTQLGSVRTHRGFTILLSKAGPSADAHVLLTFDGTPAVGAVLDDVAFVALHLAPEKDGDAKRLRQVRSALEAVSAYEKIVLAGDMSMRKRETVYALDLSDAWIATGMNRSTEHTLDSRRNRYRKGGLEFSCRFDRCFSRNLKCTSFGRIADAKRDGAHLSDHFGILVTYGTV